MNSGTDDRWRPLELTPDRAGTSHNVEGLVAWLGDTARVDELLLEHKAIVFRDFQVPPQRLDDVLDRLLSHRLSYAHGNSPRTKVGENVYTSTEYPAEFTISMHNELSYAHQWPARLLFYYEQAAEHGGATPIVDGARWLSCLDRAVRDAFAQGVRYQQCLHSGYGLGKSWQDTFETSDREEVEEFLADSAASWEWRRDGGLRITQVRPATVQHPVTGATVWFNQADQWHPASLGDDHAAELAKVLPADEMPQSVTFADGSPIPSGYVNQVRDRGLREAVDVTCRTGDLLLIDNVLVGHGRRPYRGTRRVLVAMSD
jgi:hypothetical protein